MYPRGQIAKIHLHFNTLYYSPLPQVYYIVAGQPLFWTHNKASIVLSFLTKYVTHLAVSDNLIWHITLSLNVKWSVTCYGYLFDSGCSIQTQENIFLLKLYKLKK